MGNPLEIPQTPGAETPAQPDAAEVQPAELTDAELGIPKNLIGTEIGEKLKAIKLKHLSDPRPMSPEPTKAHEFAAPVEASIMRRRKRPTELRSDGYADGKSAAAGDDTFKEK